MRVVIGSAQGRRYFDITLTGPLLSGNGTFSTDGTCAVCVPGAGLLSLTINIGPDTGAAAFDISDDALGPTAYSRAQNLLSYTGTNSETGDLLVIFSSRFSPWNLQLAGDG